MTEISERPADLHIELDRVSPVPLYHQIAKSIQGSIDDGTMPPGTRLENEIALAARLNVSRPTARRALQELVDLGLLVRKRGVGTQVAPARVRRTVDLTSLNDDLQRAGRHPRTEVLDHSSGPGDADVLEALDLEPGAEVVTVRRLRYADDEPLAVMTNYLPVDLAPSREELEAVGLYASLRGRGIEIHLAHQSIGARLATAAEARLLDERPRSALLTMQRTAYDADARPVEHGFHIYRASRYSFSTTLFA